MRQRRDAAREAEKLIDEALLRHERESRELDAVDTVKAYREKIQLHAGAELQRALRQLEAGQDPAEVMQRFQQSLINKILHAPSVQLRRLAAEKREDALRIAREILLDDSVSEDTPARQPEE